ncbi:hypothetical protein [Deinococcus aquaticus]|uniref:hypothetical protein n=1 Tax=Deinococcus aquaticus TaxID=328692 RepID=UPI003F47A283
MRILALKLAGRLVPVRALFQPGAPRPAVTRTTVTCPHCAARLLRLPRRPSPLPGSDAWTYREGLGWARWHGHLSTRPDCAAAALRDWPAPDTTFPRLEVPS